MIGHVVQYLPYAGHVIVLEEGRVAAAGTHGELVARGVRFADVVEEEEEEAAAAAGSAPGGGDGGDAGAVAGTGGGAAGGGGDAAPEPRRRLSSGDGSRRSRAPSAGSRSRARSAESAEAGDKGGGGGGGGDGEKGKLVEVEERAEGAVTTAVYWTCVRARVCDSAGLCAPRLSRSLLLMRRARSLTGTSRTAAASPSSPSCSSAA